MMCVSCALTPEQDSIDAFGAAEEGPTNQVLQIHKSIARAESIAIYFISLFCLYFAAGWMFVNSFICVIILIMRTSKIVKKKKSHL